MSNSLNSGPPRNLPFSTKMKVLFGGPFNVVGWAFFGFGMIFFVIFALGAIVEMIDFSKELETVSGQITSVEITNAKENEQPVYRVNYTFQYANKEMKGTSYVTGDAPIEGTSVEVDVVMHAPDTSRIKGMRSSLFGPFATFTALFPLIGLIFVVIGFRKGSKYKHLLVNGLITKAKLMSREGTSTRINNRMVHKHVLQFETDWGTTQEITVKTHETEKITDEDNEVLYDPFRPAIGTAIKTMPGTIRINSDGTIPEQSTFSTMQALFLPVISLIIMIFIFTL